MTPEQWYLAANAYNARQLAEAKQRHNQYIQQRGPLQTAIISQSGSTSTTRVGGGYGMGGFGGSGGYLGYGTNVDGVAGGNAFGTGDGASQGNTLRRESSQHSKSYRHTYPDLNDNGGGPVMFLNPFVRLR